MKHLTKYLMGAVWAWMATGSAHGEMVVGFPNLGCIAHNDVVTQYDSIDEACSPSTGVKSYKLESEDFATCHVCDQAPPPPILIRPTIVGPVIIALPGCIEGQHRHGNACHADHVCGDDEIGGGSEECEACPEGQEPNAAKTECRLDGTYREARCERNLDITREKLAEFLPTHPNVVVQTAGTVIQRGFFPKDEDAASRHAKTYLKQKAVLPWGDPEPIYVPSVVQEDSLQGTCPYKNVSKERYDTVKDRMLNSVSTNPPDWHQYHAIVNNSIDWANKVLEL